MLEILARLLALQWRRDGAALHEVQLGGAHVWYAEFSARTPAAAAPATWLPWRRRPAVRAAGRRAPTLVLLHGLGATAASFFPVIAALRETYRVVVPDLPGNGWSHPPRGREFLTFPELLEVVERFLEHVAPEGAYLAGNSMGGWMAAKLAARRPDLARGIALLNPGGPALRAEDWVDFGQVLTAEHAQAAPELVARLFHRPPFGARFVRGEIRRLLRAPSVMQLVATLQAEGLRLRRGALGGGVPGGADLGGERPAHPRRLPVLLPGEAAARPLRARAGVRPLPAARVPAAHGGDPPPAAAHAAPARRCRRGAAAYCGFGAGRSCGWARLP